MLKRSVCACHPYFTINFRLVRIFFYLFLNECTLYILIYYCTLQYSFILCYSFIFVCFRIFCFFFLLSDDIVLYAISLSTKRKSIVEKKLTPTMAKKKRRGNKLNNNNKTSTPMKTEFNLLLAHYPSPLSSLSLSPKKCFLFFHFFCVH